MVSEMSRYFAVSLALSLICGAKAATVRGISTGNAGNAGALEQIQSRRLVDDDEFAPLACNAELPDAPCPTTWSSLFGSDSSHSERITIPCGECVTMDHTGDTLTLDDGLDIQGKLIFPDDYSLHVFSPMIVVQGELVMTATKPVNGEPSITFTMTGQTANTFEPIGDNINVCGGGDCNIGKKSITVAGGKVDSKYSRPTSRKLRGRKGPTANTAAQSLTLVCLSQLCSSWLAR